jgi:hypothetical protein
MYPSCQRPDRHRVSGAAGGNPRARSPAPGTQAFGALWWVTPSRRTLPLSSGSMRSSQTAQTYSTRPTLARPPTASHCLAPFCDSRPGVAPGGTRSPRGSIDGNPSRSWSTVMPRCANPDCPDASLGDLTMRHHWIQVQETDLVQAGQAESVGTVRHLFAAAPARSGVRRLSWPLRSPPKTPSVRHGARCSWPSAQTGRGSAKSNSAGRPYLTDGFVGSSTTINCAIPTTARTHHRRREAMAVALCVSCSAAVAAKFSLIGLLEDPKWDEQTLRRLGCVVARAITRVRRAFPTVPSRSH